MSQDTQQNDPEQYELIIGTDVTGEAPNAESLAVARAVNSIRECWIANIHEASVYGEGDDDSQYGVRIVLSTYESPETLDQFAETVEAV